MLIIQYKMLQNSNKQVYIQFSDNRLQLHFEDKSILQSKHTSITYLSSKGIKNVISLQQIHRSPQLLSKYMKLLQYYNKYSANTDYIIFNSKSTKDSSRQQQKAYAKLGIYITQYTFQNPSIQQLEDGSYMLKSDCGYASIILHSDLYRVSATYLQYISGANLYKSKVPNMTKILLQKYNHQYTQFPIQSINSVGRPQYYYIKHTKLFTIFTIPIMWKYSLQLVWNSLIEYKVVPHRFCYIEYSKQQLKRCLMPSVRDPTEIEQKSQAQSLEKEDKVNLPILGKIMHENECKFASIRGNCAWFNVDNNDSLFYDGYGFWFYSSGKPTISYKTINKEDYDYEYHCKAIPYTLKHKSEQQRSIIQQLNIFMSYCQQNKKISVTKQAKYRHKGTDIFDKQNNIVHEQEIPDIGHFKAYSNGIIIVKYVDRTMLTLNSKNMSVKMILSNGDTSYVDLSNTDSLGYRQNILYIRKAVDFQQRVFYPQQWQQKQEIFNNIEQALQISQAVSKTNDMYLKL